MTRIGLNGLPFGIILEISSYLDVESLVAMADLNRDLRSISHSYKSYWLPTLLREGKILPLPLLRPWQSFSPQELSIATRRALFRDRNLSSERPKLYSSTRISWPFSGPKEGSGLPLGDKLKDQNPLDACWIPSLHNNGEWYITLSRDYTLRVLHLRTAVLVLEQQIYFLSNPDDLFIQATAYAIETMGASEVRVAVIMPDTNFAAESPYCSLLATYLITLDPQLVTASLKLLAQAPLTVWPKQFDIAGEYAVLMGDISVNAWGGSGPIQVVELKTGNEINLPPLLDSFGVLGFPDYFISLGISPDDQVMLQVVSLPLPEQPPQAGNQDYDGFDMAELGSEFILAGSIPITLDSGDPLDCSDDFAAIYHQYTGRTMNSIILWIRDVYDLPPRSAYNVFTVPVDFSKPPQQWFAGLEPISLEGSEVPTAWYTIDHKRLVEKDHILNYMVPGSSGKRFFFWNEVVPPDAPFESTRRMILLYSSDTNSLSLLTPQESEEDRYRLTHSYSSKEMECPYYGEIPPTDEEEHSDEDEEDPDNQECVHFVDSEDWSGTVLVTLTCGDLLVLRYGHP